MMHTLFDNVARKVEQEHIYTVTELANHVESTIKEKFSSTIRIRGEISGLKIHSNGHIYFTLKDDKSVLYAVCWKSVKLRFKLEDGMNIIANGLIKVYKERSQYQIDVREVDIAGEGEWFRIIHERSKMFETRGYFKNKRPLPKYPGIIGIVTSPTGAVIRDMEHRLLDRYPACKVFVYPANVQGNTAAQQIANGIQFFNTSIIKPDVIIVARGGGSVEDLLPFSEEVVVRSIYESKIPVISAMGAGNKLDATKFIVSDISKTEVCPLAKTIRKELRKHLEGSVRQSLSFENLCDFNINISNFCESFSLIFEALNCKLSILEKTLLDLKKIKSYLLENMFI